jgi:hypothetical protein
MISIQVLYSLLFEPGSLYHTKSATIIFLINSDMNNYQGLQSFCPQ